MAKKLIEEAGVHKGQNKGWCCRLSNMMNAVKLSTTVFNYNWQEEESSDSVCGMYLVRKSSSCVLSKLYGGGGYWRKRKLPEVWKKGL